MIAQRMKTGPQRSLNRLVTSQAASFFILLLTFSLVPWIQSKLMQSFFFFFCCCSFNLIAYRRRGNLAIYCLAYY